MSRIGFFSQVNGYWETLEEPPGHIVEKYPADTVRIPIKPGDGYAWNGAQWVESAPVVVIPQEVTRFQARAALALAGLLGTVSDYMASLPADDLRRIAWEDAKVFKRQSPTVLAMAPVLGFGDAQLDQLFIVADGIDA